MSVVTEQVNLNGPRKVLIQDKGSYFGVIFMSFVFAIAFIITSLIFYSSSTIVGIIITLSRDVTTQIIDCDLDRGTLEVIYDPSCLAKLFCTSKKTSSVNISEISNLVIDGYVWYRFCLPDLAALGCYSSLLAISITKADLTTVKVYRSVSAEKLTQLMQVLYTTPTPEQAATILASNMIIANLGANFVSSYPNTGGNIVDASQLLPGQVITQQIQVQQGGNQVEPGLMPVQGVPSNGTYTTQNGVVYVNSNPNNNNNINQQGTNATGQSVAYQTLPPYMYPSTASSSTTSSSSTSSSSYPQTQQQQQQQQQSQNYYYSVPNGINPSSLPPPILPAQDGKEERAVYSVEDVHGYLEDNNNNNNNTEGQPSYAVSSSSSSSNNNGGTYGEPYPTSFTVS